MAEENMKTLIKKRGIIKASITRISVAVSSTEPIDVHFLQIKLSNLKELANKYDDVQTQIECLAKDPDTASEDRVEMEETLCSIEHGILKALNGHSRADEGKHTNSNIQLQPIKIPFFNGNILEWQHYYSMFLELVHSRQDLTEIQKLHYLHSSLRDEPLNVIKNLPITSENYKVTLNLLRERYDNKLIIAIHHVQSILNVNPIERESLKGITNFINVITSAVNSLHAMQLPVNPFELIAIQLLVARLDSSSSRLWREKLSDVNFPNFQKFIDFLNGRRQLLENISAKGDMTKPSVQRAHAKPLVDTRQNRYRPGASTSLSYHAVSKQVKCIMCKLNHLLHTCRKYSELTAAERKEFLIKNRCCLNCLRIGHDVNGCANRGTCKVCTKKHHTSIHANESSNSKAEGTYCSLKLQTDKNVLLSTAIADVTDSRGYKHSCRLLLDSGSQANFCTLKFARKLRLPLHDNKLPITGINNSVCQSHYSVDLKISSRYEDFTFEATCAVLPNLTDKLPAESFSLSHLNVPDELFLADPDFNVSQDIDILLGAQFYLALMRSNKFARGPSYPIVQETKLGYILGGNLPMPRRNTKVVQSFFTKIEDETISKTIEKFWAIEEVSSPILKSEQSECETHFTQNTTRNREGRFVVSLPRKPNRFLLGDSYPTARRRFLNLEHKFQRDPVLKGEYSNFIREYLDLGHMSPLIDIPLRSGNNTDSYYLPHHAVIKQTSLTTKLRVVFDASAKTTNGLSLNDTLLVGPTVQQDLFSIIIRFRIHNYVLIADIAKMYRQVLINPVDCHLQRILWRESPEQELQHFILKTLTYGTASASFLATRCLLQIGLDNQMQYPAASNAIINDFYVDDLLTGSDTLSQLKQLKTDVAHLLLQYGFPLHKWFSNDNQIVHADDNPSITLSKGQNIHTLGLVWNNATDSLTYETTHKGHPNPFTKRSVLSTIAGIYDPLGLLGPVVFLCKHYMQRLWLHKIGWDDPLPDTLHSNWSRIYDRLDSIQSITVARAVKHKFNTITSLHVLGFADASTKGYACSIYIRVTYDNNYISCNLLCSKSKVAPLKQISVPRTELCACLLLSRLLVKIMSATSMRPDEIRLHTDSMIALHWIHADPTRWKTFVANRVAEIQQKTSNAKWYHVQSRDNPADIASRGCLPHVLKDCKLWWHGPSWLLHEIGYCQMQPFQTNSKGTIPECQLEERPVHSTVLISTVGDDLSVGFSSLSRLIRVYSYCFRFIHNARTQLSNRKAGRMTVHEETKTLMFFVRQTQSIYFHSEIERLQKDQSISKQSKLLSLNAFLDEFGILRVGGRLQQAKLAYDNKHPMILPPKAHITRLAIEAEHRRLLHAGPQLVHHSLRQRYWIINGKQIVRSIIRKCTRCIRFNFKRQSQLLGQLPYPRVTPSRPFLNCAVDYGGPFIIRLGGQKSKVLTKAYVSLFVCLSTKAIHVELVSDLTADAFIAALRRFTSRRGLPACIYSDNGTNFRAARGILHELSKALANKDLQSSIHSYAVSQGIEWSFIPPSSPHFGGLWESGIRSLKFHLRRVVGKAILNFEEFYTILTQIEACLNSRPLFAVSTDHRDPTPLTPGHFLICAPLTAIPCQDLHEVPLNRLGRWQLLQKFVQSIWKVWSRDYLHQMQQRNKWRRKHTNLSPGDLVLLCEENTSPLHWRYGIVTDAHPGPDGLVRVVSIRTAHGNFRRPVHKLCLVPKQEE